MAVICRYNRTIIGLTVLFLLFHAQSAISSPLEDFSRGLESFRSANFSRAKRIFVDIIKKEKDTIAAKKSIAYLALIELAHRNEKAAKKYLFQLFSVFPGSKEDIVGIDLTPNYRDLFRQVKSTIDNQNPQGRITGIGRKYEKGDLISFNVIAHDDIALNEITVSIEKTSLSETWKVENKEAEVAGSFPTDQLTPGIYRCSLRVKDTFGNTSEDQHSFEIYEGPDVIDPDGAIVGINRSYIRGLDIAFRFTAEDEGGLKRILFAVLNTPIQEQWNIEGKYIEYDYSFSTDRLSLGAYSYVLEIEDEAGNINKKTGTFELIKEPDKQKPSGEITGAEKRYFVGEDVAIRLSARDNESVREISFSLNGTDIHKVWKVDGSQIEKSFTILSSEVSPGIYGYVFSIVDSSGNSIDYTGTLQISRIDDRTDPVGEVVGIKEDYILGELVSFIIKAGDNDGLEQVSFQILRSDIKKRWALDNQKSIELKFMFKTEAFVPGTYVYLVEILDRSDNVSTINGEFVLKKHSIQYGYINIFSKPWTEIFIDGESYGRTPKANIQLSVGTKSIRLLNREMGIDVTETVNIIANETLKKSYDLSGRQVQAGQYGYVNLITVPWAEIIIDGKSYGNTPKAKLRLPTGRKKIRFLNRSEGIDVVKYVNIVPNRLVKESFRLK